MRPCQGALSQMGQPRQPCIPCLRRIPALTRGAVLLIKPVLTPIGWVCTRQRLQVAPDTED